MPGAQGEGAERTGARVRPEHQSFRLRGPKMKPKRRAVTRVVAIGDSVTHGWGVSYE